jgi:hypothetical protein
MLTYSYFANHNARHYCDRGAIEQGLLVGHQVWHFGSMLFSSNSNLFVIDNLNILLGVDNFNVAMCNCPYMADLVECIRAINVRHYMLHFPWKLHTKGL